MPIALYGVLCDYGQNYLQPLGWLLALIVVGAVQFWPAVQWDCWLALGFSTANTLGSRGVRKEMVDPDILRGMSRWLVIVSCLQMPAGLILLFLTGLCLRNRFRMK